MANRSSLELMLEKIQQLEDRPKDIPPALPVRPVSRARGGRPPRLNFHTQNFEKENGGVFSCEIKGTKKEELCRFPERVRAMDNCKELNVIQKWYRGHKVRRSYEELRTGAVALQSYVRGKNARRNFDYMRRRRLEAIVVIQKHVRKYLKHKRVNGGYRDQWHCNETKHEPKPKKANEDSLLNVPYDVVVDLWRRALVTEARAREKKEESEVLRVKIREIKEKWRGQEERMATMEKAWQDQLMHIQKCLEAKSHEAAAAGGTGGFIRLKKCVHVHPLPRPHYYSRRLIINADDKDHHAATNGGALGMNNGLLGDNDEQQQEEEEEEHSDVHVEVVGGVEKGLHPQEELCKLKQRFKAWKREYRVKLRDLQSTFNKKSRMNYNWWARFS